MLFIIMTSADEVQEDLLSYAYALSKHCVCLVAMWKILMHSVEGSARSWTLGKVDCVVQISSCLLDKTMPFTCLKTHQALFSDTSVLLSSCANLRQHNALQHGLLYLISAVNPQPTAGRCAAGAA